jgi:hypothetical protein
MLLPVLLDPELVAAMSRKAAGIGRADADRQLAAEVLRVMAAGRQRAGRQRAGRRH